MKILGIDPGSSRMGYGVIEEQGSDLRLLMYGVLEVQEPPATKKIAALAEQLRKLLDEVRPDVVGVETLFFSNNQKTAMEVSQARGVILLVLSEKKIPTVECSPRTVKQATTGYGLADKRAVAKMVTQILQCGVLTGYDDASDALAVAITVAGEVRARRRVDR